MQERFNKSAMRRRSLRLAQIPLLGAIALFSFVPRAEAVCNGFPNTLTNGTTADANQVMANFNYIFDCPLFTTQVKINTLTYARVEFASAGANQWTVGTRDTNDFYIYRETGSTNVLIPSGNLSVGISSPVYRLDVAGDARFGGGGPGTIHLYGSSIYDVGNWLHFSAANVYVDGVLWTPTGGVSASSDVRLKKSIEPISGALDTVMRLQPIRYKWRNPKQHYGIEAFGGFAAQDVQKVFPELVSETRCEGDDCKLVAADKKTLGVSLGQLFDAYVVAAVQELKHANDALAAENKALRTEMDALRADVQALRQR